MSVDPLSPDYPSWTPYAFAMNRVIDGIDLDGLEWVYTPLKHSGGQFYLGIGFSGDFSDVSFPEGITIEDYKTAIKVQFDETITKSFGSGYSGVLEFNPDYDGNQVTPSLLILTSKPPANRDPDAPYIAGGTTYEISAVQLYNKHGNINSPESLALSAIHELFHTIRLDHPFEITQGDDATLVGVGVNQFETVNGTHKNIFQHIMNYGLITIDGIKLSDLWGNQDGELLTPGQLDFLIQEIDLQRSGYGKLNYDSNLSDEENDSRYYEYILDYWDQTRGTKIQKK